MRRSIILAGAVLVGLGAASPALAIWPFKAIYAFGRDAVRNNRWPEPFVYPDREAVRAPLCIMVHNGWRRQNTLTDAHFTEKGAQLTEAGRLKVRWITTQAPLQARVIYVLRTDDPELTADRIAAAQEAAAYFAQGDIVPEVLETQKAYERVPADYVDVIERKFRETTPEPRLPEPTASDANE